jgi:hypothetical protein
MGSPIFPHSVFHYSMGVAIRVGDIKKTATFAWLQRLRIFNGEM